MTDYPTKAPTAFMTPSGFIETYRDGGIRYSTANFHDQEIMEALKGCLENNKINSVSFLRHLQSISKSGVI